MKLKLMLAGLCSAAMLVGATAAPAETLELTVFYNDKDNFGDSMRWWVDEVKERTEGRVLIKPVYNGALAKLPETLDAVRDGAVPMGVGLASFMTGVMPTLAYFEMIGGLPSSAPDASKVLTQHWGDVRNLFKSQGVVPLWGQVAFGTGVICRDKFLKSAADWKGQTVRAAGRWQSKQITAMGATPVPIDPGELYVALQNGTVKCALMNPTIIKSLRLYEVAPYYTNMDLPSNLMTYIINDDSWKKLSDKDRATISATSMEAMNQSIPYIKQKMDEQISAITAGGGKVYAATPEERKTFMTASQPILKEIGAAAGAAGKPIGDALSAYW
jgi:TRAP-type C4-dicarboxylate transport system substrate-binding protein